MCNRRSQIPLGGKALRDVLFGEGILCCPVTCTCRSSPLIPTVLKFRSHWPVLHHQPAWTRNIYNQRYKMFGMSEYIYLPTDLLHVAAVFAAIGLLKDIVVSNCSKERYWDESSISLLSTETWWRVRGTWLLIGRVDSCRPEGRGFESRSSRHI